MGKKKANSSKKAKKITRWIINILVGIICTVFAGLITNLIGDLNANVARLDEKFLALNERVARLETNIPVSNLVTSPSDQVVDKTDPLDLQNVIMTKQKEKVKVSYNIDNCFMDIDLQSFKTNKIPDQSVNELLIDNSFIDLVIAIKKMNSTERQKLLDASSNIAKKSWASMGEISPDGQTEAGREAELLIAKAIVAKVNELIKLTEKELEKMKQ